MAKKKSTEDIEKKAVKKVKKTAKPKTPSNEFTFDDINKSLDKISLYGSRMDVSTFSEIDHFISLGNYALNACMTGSIFGGIPNNRAVSLAGKSGAGKTYLLLNAVRNAIGMGYYVIFYDSENAVDKDLMVKFGIDVSKVRYEPVASLQDFRTNITNLITTLGNAKREGKTIPKIFVALDSAGNLPTQKEINDAVDGNEKADMTRAKLLKSVFRIIMVPLAYIKAPFVFTNHTYDSQSFISMTTSSGGSGPQYAASIILFLGKKQLTEGSGSNKIKSGIQLKAMPNKNRFAQPQQVVVHLRYDSGMNPYVGLEQYLDYEAVGIGRGVIKDGVKVPQKTAKTWIAEHLDYEIKKAKQLYTPEVFTDEVLKKLDEYIYPIFNYGINDEIPDDLIYGLNDNDEIETTEEIDIFDEKITEINE